MYKIYQNILVVKIIVLLLLIPIKSALISADVEIFAQTNLSCDQLLEKAEDAYYDSEFNKSLEFIRLSLKDSNINDEQRIKAYTILTRTFIAMDQVEKAKVYIKNIFELKPDYLPTLEEETPKYVNTVLLVKNEMVKKTKTVEESGISSWIWIGAGGVVTAAAIVIIASSGENKKENKDQPLSEPPLFP